jgi:hypothetical protein
MSSCWRVTEYFFINFIVIERVRVVRCTLRRNILNFLWRYINKYIVNRKYKFIRHSYTCTIMILCSSPNVNKVCLISHFEHYYYQMNFFQLVRSDRSLVMVDMEDMGRSGTQKRKIAVRSDGRD